MAKGRNRLDTPIARDAMAAADGIIGVVEQ
jgi:hypothetical protein